MVAYNSTPRAFSIILGMFMLIIISCSISAKPTTNSQKVPAMYIFGDSLVDVGNNNYLKFSYIKANFPFNGIDYPGRKSTGRFCNGKNFADFLAEKMGFRTSQPPYLSLVSSSKYTLHGFPMTGVSFASGAAGIFNGSDGIFKQSIPLNEQVQHYHSAVYKDLVHRIGLVAAEEHLSKSLFVVVIGSGDLLGYFKEGSEVARKIAPQRYIDSMALDLKRVLEKMHNLGARKYLVTGIGKIGCCPSMRTQNEDGECNEVANRWTANYNQALGLMLQQLKSELKNEISYSYVDTFFIFDKFIQTPATYGFTEIKSACCGLGNLRAEIPCSPISQYCSNRTAYIFWDSYHPTEAANRILIDNIFDGSPQYSNQMPMKEQIAT